VARKLGHDVKKHWKAPKHLSIPSLALQNFGPIQQLPFVFSFSSSLAVPTIFGSQTMGVSLLIRRHDDSLAFAMGFPDLAMGQNPGSEPQNCW
jgi:hypothetical protein